MYSLVLCTVVGLLKPPKQSLDIKKLLDLSIIQLEGTLVQKLPCIHSGRARLVKGVKSALSSC